MIRAVLPEEMTWLTERSSWVPSASSRGILQELNGKVNAMVVYDEWTPDAARIHVAIDNPLACRGFLRAAFEYPFVEAAKNLLWTIIPSANYRCARLVQRLGFVETHRVLGGWAAGVPLCFYELRKSRCQWLKEKVT